MLEDNLNQDLKKALLAGDKTLATTLRGLKSALLYAKIATQSRDRAMPDGDVIAVFKKEAKKRQESADLYIRGGDQARAEAELQEKEVIERYLPAQLSDAEVSALVDAAIAELGASGPAALGQVITRVKHTTAGAADGATIARIVRERLNA